MSARHLPAALGRRPLVVASLGDCTRLESDARRAAKDGADLLEIRADLFPRAQLKPQTLRSLLRHARSASRRKLLLTLRRGEEGGGLSKKFREQDRLALMRAVMSDVDGIDVELGADDINRHVVFEAHKRKKFVVVSIHDFKGTPRNAVLSRWVSKARRLGADIVKVACRPSRAGDVARLMDYCAIAHARRKVFIPMGPLGRDARENGFKWGSLLTYGYVRKPVASGQWPVSHLAESARRLSRS